MNEPLVVAYHQDARLFGDALRFTSAETGFSERLIEKDYYCSVALACLCGRDAQGLVFKGGTCLSKVHADFFRLSEDLDFAISFEPAASRQERSDRMAPIKKKLAGLVKLEPALRIDQPLKGSNESRQYNAQLAYTSSVTGQEESVKVEVSLRELTVEPVALQDVRTMLRDPFRGTPAVAAFPAPVLSRREAYAEKLRAALTRRPPAIRDLFDLDHALSAEILNLNDAELIELLRNKLAIPGNEAVDLSAEKIQRLREQVDTQLRPVLRADDFARFNLERALDQLRRAEQAIND